ncbi:MAG: UDP-N-acetylmuramate--L-alanine ligase [Candidatus Omnitrophica bacterium]|nr:UDP-N-acetylmuramate--L-alanine ligase [Candidatus Omnitrophota bacterium]
MLKGVKKIHFIGIGGIGMSGIAWLCLKKGYRISGSDIKSSNITERLIGEGAEIEIGHRPENIDDADIVVYSSAILSNNPELTEAKKKKIPMQKRGEFLAYLAKSKRCIAVSGAHGKTTTSSMVSTMLKEANLTPSGVVGALVPYLNGNAFIGDGEFFVVEADESDGSFLYLKPTYAVVTNIDLEHLDYYEGIEQIQDAYVKFVNSVTTRGAAVCWGDGPYIRKILKRFKRRLITYGFSKGNTLYASSIKLGDMHSEFNCAYQKKDIGPFRIRVPGEHNILNAMAAIAVGLDIGLEPDTIRSAIFQFKGAQRRFQVKAEINDMLIIDDYAHHPTEIKATLKAARNIGRKRLVSVFQPHRYTRTKFLKKEFARAFGDTDFLILTDIYAANEKPIYGVTSMNIYSEVIKLKKINANYIIKDRLLDYLAGFLRPGDIVLFLGAGDIGRLSGEFILRLKAKQERIVARAGV